MRTIMYSNERVTANNWEAGLFILFLLIFAIAASWHVFSHGIQVGDRGCTWPSCLLPAGL
jgi:cation-transporting ATPase 13A1